jgi:diaminopimelate epimerase
MPISFTKYHGAGNDFIMIDQREKTWIQRTDKALVAQMCHRRFGIGADGLILLQNHEEYGVEMVYFNSDGGESTLCGNGGRCFTAFARYLGLAQEQFRFLAIDGPHEAIISNHPDGQHGHDWVELHMNDVIKIERLSDDVFVLNTGSPHYISFVSGLQDKDMVAEGRAIRYSDKFSEKGINVNLVEPITTNSLSIRTYERGVEDETLACGTGVTAAALAYSLRNGLQGKHYILVSALGGNLAVHLFATDQSGFTDIWLCGPAKKVYDGLY